MVELAALVVEPEQQRSDVRPRAILVPPEAGHDAIRGPLVLDLEHRPLTGLIAGVDALGDDTVEAGALEPLEPVAGRPAIRGRRREVDRRLYPRQRRLQPSATLALRDIAQVVIAERQQVPGDEARRRLGGQHVHARGCRMDAKEQRVEVERPVAGDDHFPVDDGSLR